MDTGSSSLLRPSPAPLVRAALLGFLALAVAPPLATAASHSPDPSPAGGLLAPDAYPDPAAPVQHAIPMPITTVRVYVQQPVGVTAAPKRGRIAPVARQKPKEAVSRSTAPAVPIRLPDQASRQFVALGRAAVGSPQHASRRLVLALGLLVLLSASLVAGAARELAA